MNIHPRPTHGQSDSRFQDKYDTCSVLHPSTASSKTRPHQSTARPGNSTRQRQKRHRTSTDLFTRQHKKAASYHTPLKIWDSAPTPLLAIISTTERRVQTTYIWMTSNICLTKTSHHPNSEFELSTKQGHTTSTNDERPPIHREVPNPRPHHGTSIRYTNTGHMYTTLIYVITTIVCSSPAF